MPGGGNVRSGAPPCLFVPHLASSRLHRLFDLLLSFMITLNLQHDVVSRAAPTDQAMQIAVMFGLSLDGTQRHAVLPPIQLTLKPGQIIFVTGVSGGGKSTLLRLVAQSIREQSFAQATPAPALVFGDQLPPLPDEPLVDALASPLGGEAEPSATGADLKQV